MPCDARRVGWFCFVTCPLVVLFVTCLRLVPADLVLEETFGKVYPYCFVDLDDQNMRTSSVQCSSINPSWQEDLTFEVSIQQWVLSNLRIHVSCVCTYVLCDMILIAVT